MRHGAFRRLLRLGHPDRLGLIAVDADQLGSSRQARPRHHSLSAVQTSPYAVQKRPPVFRFPTEEREVCSCVLKEQLQKSVWQSRKFGRCCLRGIGGVTEGARYARDIRSEARALFYGSLRWGNLGWKRWGVWPRTETSGEVEQPSYMPVSWSGSSW